MASGRGGVLELAVLGSLHETPLHGYELRKRLNALLGMFRAFSYGSLYPCLRQLLTDGLIVEDSASDTASAPAESPITLTGRRSKIVYKLTAEGKERLSCLSLHRRNIGEPRLCKGKRFKEIISSTIESLILGGSSRATRLDRVSDRQYLQGEHV